MNIAFYSSGKATRVRKIIQEASQDILESTKFILCDNLDNSDLEEVEKLYDIKFFEIDYRRLDEKNINRQQKLSDYLLKQLENFNVDFCFCFGDHILRGELLSKYENKIVNFHPSILPAYPGRKAIDQALLDNAQLLGNTAHFIDEGIDTGLIIMQNIISRKIFDIKGYEGILDQQLPMFFHIFDLLKNNKIKINEKTLIIEGAEYLHSTFYPK